MNEDMKCDRCGKEVIGVISTPIVIPISDDRKYCVDCFDLAMLDNDAQRPEAIALRRIADLEHDLAKARKNIKALEEATKAMCRGVLNASYRGHNANCFDCAEVNEIVDLFIQDMAGTVQAGKGNNHETIA